MSKISISFRDFGKPIQVPTGERMVIEVSRSEGALLEMEDLNFHFDSAVLLPDPKCDDDPGVPAEDRITGLAVLRVCYLHAKDNPDQEILIAGHTDTTGQASYNLTLSQLRAENVLLALTGDGAGWAKSSDQKHKVEDYQHILKWVATTFGWSCDPGDVDDDEGPQTHRALLGFQKRYNSEFDETISVDGAMGPETWKAFFDVYTLELKTLLETDDAGLATLQAQLKFLAGAPKTVGCGEFHPIAGAHGDRPGTAESETKVGPTLGQPTDPKGADEFRSVTNRRVEILFFDPGHRPKLDCHPSAGKCSPDVCEIYRVGAFDFSHIACDPRTGTASVVTWLTKLPDGADEATIELVARDESGQELQRFAAASAAAGPDGTKVFDLSPLDPAVTVLLQLEQDGVALGTREKLAIRDLRRSLAQQDAPSAGRQLTVDAPPVGFDELDGSDPSLATAIASSAGDTDPPAGVTAAGVLA